MSDQQNLDVVRSGYQAFASGDIPGLLRLLHDDVTWSTPGPADLPIAGTRTGHQAVQEFFTALTEIGETLRFEPTEFIAHGNKVVVLIDDTTRIKATGNSLDFRWAHIFELRNGKVASFEERGDVSALVAELRTAKARV